MPLDRTTALFHEHDDVDYANIFEGLDAPGTISTNYTMRVGDTFIGSLTPSDFDFVRLDVTAGQTYVITLVGTSSAGISDPYLGVVSSSGFIIAENDDGGPGLTSLLTYTATNTGSIFLVADTYSGNESGRYELAVDVGSAPVPPPVGTFEEMATYLTDGNWETTNESRHTFDSSTITVNLNGLTFAGQELARWALEAWEMIADLNFVEVSFGEDITFIDNDSGAYSSYVASSGTTSESLVNVSTSWLAQFGTTIDSYSFTTYVHEIGHALGLGHMGDYNGSANYFNDAEFENDSLQLSIMSYFSTSDNPNVSGSDALVVTGQIVDIIAIQELYGAADGGATAGATTYGLNSNLGNYMDDVFEALSSGNNSSDFFGDDIAFTIFDEGGTDTLDFSTDNSGQQIDMRAGTMSSVYGLTNNMAIAQGTLIENVETGSGNDSVRANGGDNEINTRGGNDTINANGGGDDTINGGGGTDEVRLSVAFSAVTSGSASGSSVTFSGAFGSLNVTNVETFAFSDRTYTLSELANELDDLGDGGGTGGGGGGPVVPPGPLTDGTPEDDEFAGTANADNLSGRAGNDLILGLAGNDNIEGGIGFDSLYGGDGNDSLVGNNGYDYLFGEAGNDTLIGNNGFDFLAGGSGDDLMYGGVSPDDMYGGSDEDDMYGQAGFDNMYGEAGNDVMNGNAGADYLSGGDGNDTMEGGLNNDTIDGDAGNDRLSGANGRDVLNGGSGNDNLRGNAGNDTLNGDQGNDTLNGGLGSDTFIYTGGHDVISDFQRRNDSMIIEQGLLDAVGIDLDNATDAELDAFFQVVNGNLFADLGNGNSLTVNGYTDYTQLVDDVTFVYF